MRQNLHAGTLVRAVDAIQPPENEVWGVGCDLMHSRHRRSRLAFKFFMEQKELGTWFTEDQLLDATGWKKASVRTYYTKKWARHIERDGTRYRVVGFDDFTLEDFIRLQTQKDH